MKTTLILSLSLTAAPALALEPITVTRDEFKMHKHYKNALEDPRVQKMKPEARLGAIAKDAKQKPKDLQAAIDKVEAAGDLKAKCEANLKEAFEASSLKGRMGKLEADLTEEHAVAYVQWNNEKPEALPVEAATVAATALTACPLVSSIQVWAQDLANPKSRVFQGLISGSAAANIKADKIADFAQTRYLRLFEKVKSVQNNDDFSAENAAAAAAAGNAKP
jgi:hypothetical protein